MEELQIFAGSQDCHLQILSRQFHTPVILRDHTLQFLEVEESLAPALKQTVAAMFDLIDERRTLSDQDVTYLCSLAKEQGMEGFQAKNLAPIAKTRAGKIIYPRTKGQAVLADAFRNQDIVFAVGPAGTGKTYLAVAHAVSRLKKQETEKIILTRPAVEAGESLGFLPGDMKEKVDPYLRPLYDALNELLGQETTQRFIEKDVIEIAPLAFMRGRTLNNAVVILDEAQNTTKAQMKMFLTRMGRNAQLIITGDVTQIDLVRRQDSGLVQAAALLEPIEGIGVVWLHEKDVVRHPLVQKIIQAYSTVE